MHLCAHSRHASSLNIVLAISPVLGVVAYMIYPGSMNRHIFYLFLRCLAIPSLRGHGPKFIMMDNLSSHVQQHVFNAALDAGHTLAFRPTHSPDFSPVEYCFHEIKAYVRRKEPMCRTATLLQWTAGGVNMLTPRKISSFFSHCGYYVPGHDFRPYFGSQ